MNDDIKTIEDLAAMIQRTMASKEDLQNLATKEDLNGVKDDLKSMEERLTGRLDTLDARVGRIEADVHTLQEEMVHKRDFEDALDRIKYIERKLGIESGVS